MDKIDHTREFDELSTIQMLQQHRSIRRFKEHGIEEKLLNEIIKSGQAASTSSFIQAVSLIQVRDKTLRSQMAKLSGDQKYVESCAEFFVFCADLRRNSIRAHKTSGQYSEFDWTEQFVTATVDVSLFAQNVSVAAESVGLGICYIGGIRNNPEQISDLLNLPELVYPVFGLCLGYPDQNPSAKPRLPKAAIVHQDRYSETTDTSALIDEYDQRVKAYYRERTRGKIEHSWSEQMHNQAQRQKRKFMKEFLQKQGFMKR